MTTQNLTWQHCTNGHNPPAWEHHESFAVIGALDDFSFELRHDFLERLLEFRPLIAAVGKQLFKNGYIPNRVARSRMPPSRSWRSAG